MLPRAVRDYDTTLSCTHTQIFDCIRCLCLRADERQHGASEDENEQEDADNKGIDKPIVADYKRDRTYLLSQAAHGRPLGYGECRWVVKFCVLVVEFRSDVETDGPCV